MSLIVNTNVASINASRTLMGSTKALNKSLQQLSSGLRINKAADDAAGLAIAEGFNSVVRGSIVAQRNAQDGISMVQTAEGALSETHSILQRMRELSVQAANGTQNATTQGYIKAEMDELILQIDAIAADTEFNGTALLDGSTATVTLQVGVDEGQTMDVTLTESTASELKVDSVDVTSDAEGAITDINDAIETVSNTRSALGATQNRLEFTVNTLAIQEENSAAAESAIRDADIARVSTEYTKNQILVASGTQVLAQSNMLPQNALSLFG